MVGHMTITSQTCSFSPRSVASARARRSEPQPFVSPVITATIMQQVIWLQ
jgi:hypothetical protein